MSNKINMQNQDNQQNQDYGKEISGWEVKEYERKENSKTWNTVLMIGAAVVLLLSLITANFLFSLFIIIAVVVVMMNENKPPLLVEFKIFEDGIKVGQKFYAYAELKNFSIVYIPRENVRQLYFEFKSPVKQRISIPFHEVNPIFLRKELKKFLKEDLDRDHIPLSEQLAKIFGF